MAARRLRLRHARPRQGRRHAPRLRLDDPLRHPDLLPSPARLRRAALRHRARRRCTPTASASIRSSSTRRWSSIRRCSISATSASRVPFAFALGALMMRYPGEKWIHITRRWTMVTWLFLTCGICLGMHWAYAVLGWGGYWGWDPVENASPHALARRHRLPALRHDAGEARHDEGLERLAHLRHVHALHPRHAAHALRPRQLRPRLRRKRHRQLVLRLPAASSSSSASSPSSASAITSSAENKLESLVSRESIFLFNNLVLLTACFTILWGTLFPVLSEYVQGSKVTMGPPFYNRVAVPIGLFLHLPHRSRPAARLARHIDPLHPPQPSASLPRHHRQRHRPDDHRPAPLERS